MTEPKIPDIHTIRKQVGRVSTPEDRIRQAADMEKFLAEVLSAQARQWVTPEVITESDGHEGSHTLEGK